MKQLNSACVTVEFLTLRLVEDILHHPQKD